MASKARRKAVMRAMMAGLRAREMLIDGLSTKDRFKIACAIVRINAYARQISAISGHDHDIRSAGITVTRIVSGASQ